MSKEEKIKYQEELARGLELAEYRMLRDKAMRNQTIVHADEKGNIVETPAREIFVKLYNEPVPQF